MTLGEKIKNRRHDMGFSQDKLSQEMNVSRSAIAKWESDKGIPDIPNLVKLANIFSVSLDHLLNENLDEVSKKSHNIMSDAIDSLIGKSCDIEAMGWNDGVYDVLIVGHDSEFIFYLTQIKEREMIGAFSKSLITKISESKKINPLYGDFVELNRESFIGKNVSINLRKKDGFIAGFFDFRDDDYDDVEIAKFSEDEIVLSFGSKIKLNEITKIQER